MALGAVALFGTKVGRSLLGKIVTEEPLPIQKSAFALASSGVAVSAIGLSTASAAVGLAITAGGVGILTSLRSGYKIIDSRDGYLALQKS